jgi:hypothetical protein
MNLDIDERKIRPFVELEKKVQKLKAEKDLAEKSMTRLQEAYNNARQAALQGMADWAKVGPAHIDVLKLSQELEKLSAAVQTAQNDLNNARPVLVDEVLKIARAAIG